MPDPITIGLVIGGIGLFTQAVGAIEQDNNNKSDIERQREAAGISNQLLQDEYTHNRLQIDNQLASLGQTQGLLKKQKGRSENQMRSVVGASGFAMAGSMQEELDFQNQQFDMKLADVGRAINEGNSAGVLLGKTLTAKQKLNDINAEQLNAAESASTLNTGLNLLSSGLNFGSQVINTGTKANWW